MCDGAGPYVVKRLERHGGVSHRSRARVNVSIVFWVRHGRLRWRGRHRSSLRGCRMAVPAPSSWDESSSRRTYGDATPHRHSSCLLLLLSSAVAPPPIAPLSTAALASSVVVSPSMATAIALEVSSVATSSRRNDSSHDFLRLHILRAVEEIDEEIARSRGKQIHQ